MSSIYKFETLKNYGYYGTTCKYLIKKNLFDFNIIYNTFINATINGIILKESKKQYLRYFNCWIIICGYRDEQQ